MRKKTVSGIMLTLFLGGMLVAPFVRAEYIFLYDTVFIEPEAVKVYVGENVNIVVRLGHGFEPGHPPIIEFSLGWHAFVLDLVGWVALWDSPTVVVGDSSMSVSVVNPYYDTNLIVVAFKTKVVGSTVLDLSDSNVYTIDGYVASLPRPPLPFAVHNINTELNYTTIQEAINAPETLNGHTIWVEAGVYFENVVVNKSISLLGENKLNTIIDGIRDGNVIHISANNVTITGFTVQNSGQQGSDSGVFVPRSSLNTISGNIFRYNKHGIRSEWSANNIISRNTMTTNDWGLKLWGSSNDTISKNNITDNRFGVELLAPSGHSIYHNNFHNNTRQVYTISVDVWDDGYPSGGNYWSNYKGVDLYSGPYQNETGSDGIGDTPYIIDEDNLDEDNRDNYPLMYPRQSVHLSVPFHYQTTTYYCGPAALEMVFDYYGEDIPQMEIADVARTSYLEGGTFTDEMRRAAHFSNRSISLGDEMPGDITGYSARKIGYAAFEKWELTVDDVKTLINAGEPLIALMWWSPAKVYGHYRVVVGYTETHVIMHDPWNKDLWGGTWGGPDTSMTYSTFLDLWAYSGNWGLWVHPWNIELQIPSLAYDGENFTVTAHISYPCSSPFNVLDYPASLCNATIKLQPGLQLASGETPQHAFGNINAGNTVRTAWTIHAYETGLHTISVTATGIVEGSVWAHGTYPAYNYEDAIGLSYVDVAVFVTIVGDVDGDGDVDGFDLTRMCGAYGSTSDDPEWDEPCDINGDGVIDGFDLTPACGNYGKTL